MTHLKFKDTGDTVTSPQVVVIHNPADGEYSQKEKIRLASRFDSMFHYFEEQEVPADSCEDISPEDDALVIGRIDDSIATLLKDILSTNDNTLDVNMETPPSWHINRNETFTVNAFIDNKDWLFNNLDTVSGYNTLFLKADFMSPQGYPGSRADKEGMWYDVFPLLQEVNSQNEIIMSALHKDLSHRDSMRVLIDPLTKIYECGLEEQFDPVIDSAEDDEGEPDPRKYYNWSNWFLKAQYLSDSLHKVYPRNFRNIVIYGAAKLIAQDHLKVTKLQQYLAAMGRTGTRLILVD